MCASATGGDAVSTPEEVTRMRRCLAALECHENICHVWKKQRALTRTDWDLFFRHGESDREKKIWGEKIFSWTGSLSLCFCSSPPPPPHHPEFRVSDDRKTSRWKIVFTLHSGQKGADNLVVRQAAGSAGFSCTRSWPAVRLSVK